jgi:hypothetical protein
MNTKLYSKKEMSALYDNADCTEDNVKFAANSFVCEIDMIEPESLTMLSVSRLPSDCSAHQIPREAMEPVHVVSVNVPSEITGIHICAALHRFYGENYDTFWGTLNDELLRLANLAWSIES